MIVHPEFTWLNQRLRRGCALELDEQGRLLTIHPTQGDQAADRTCWLASPALCDLQVNGSGDVLLNENPTADSVRHLIQVQRSLGTGWIMPTLISDSPEIMSQAVDAVIEVFPLDGLIGLHLEGPHLNPARRGTHDRRFVRALDDHTFKQISRLRDREIPVLITLAPECLLPGQLPQLIELGVIVSLGHSEADAAAARRAFSMGARAVTHLFNAMSPMLSRAPGLTGASIDSEAYVGLIADGVHVDWTMLRIATRARPVPGRCFLVSDAMASVAGRDHFELQGSTVYLREGRLVNSEGVLAGAHLYLVQALRNAHRHLDLPLDDLVAMVCDVPWRVMGLEPPVLQPGRVAGQDLLLMDFEP